ncbi:MAG: filamentous hemagglutinin N-terminal domain-containing protein, partial [Pseudomonadales bacterium]|nr:filamentous hemagglutinin N-terminal domain-containing protein [Pseudomonadales bacterium]
MKKGRTRKGRNRGAKPVAARSPQLDTLPVSALARPNKLKPLTSFMLQRGLVATGIAGSLLFAPLLQAAPEGGVVIDGEGTVTHVDDMTTHIDQMTQNLLMEFESFDLSADESVLITQPNASAWFVGNVVGGSPTAIFGNITANGQVALVNASGVIFGETASINAAGVFASALDINTEDLVNGEAVNFEAKPGSGGFVINHGLISASVGGSVTLLGQSVTNSGVIMATLGQVNLAAGSRAVVNFGPEQLIGIEVTQEVLENNEGLRAAINNTGTIDAEGGAVMLTSSVSKSLFDYAINNEGVVKAKTARLEDGVIKLTGRGSSVLNMGVLDASAEEGDGGSISVSSDQAVMLGSGSAILTDSKGGVAGSIDVSGDAITVADRASVSASGALGGGEIQLAAGSALTVEQGASLLADATVEGDGGLISMAGDDVQFAGTATARGGAVAGDGGTVTITARDNLDFSGVVDVSAPQGDAGELVFNVESVSIEEDDQIRASALEAVQGDIEINATGRVELADLGGDTLDLGGSALTINVDGVALSAAESDAIGFFMQGAADTLTTRGQVTVAVTDGSVNANALIDIAGRVESTPVPDPLPNEPQNPGNSIAMTANQGRIRIRDTAELDVSGDDDAGAITLTATGFDEETESGTVFFNGSIDATSDSGVGGTVKLLGDRVGLFGEASIDASGALGGGEILVGGNYQGKGPEMNAQQTVVAADVSISADALESGDGGTIIVWSDGFTRFYGDITARGVGDGDGGFAEVSGSYLEFRGGADLSSDGGVAGTLLLDPADIDIVAADATNTMTDADLGAGATFVSTQTMTDAAPSILLAGDIEALLEAGTSVIVDTTQAMNTEAGNIRVLTDITVDATLTMATTAKLTLDADGSIAFGPSGEIVNTTGNITLDVQLIAAGGGITSTNSGTEIDIGGSLTLTATSTIGTSAADALDISIGTGGLIDINSSGATYIDYVGSTEAITLDATGHTGGELNFESTATGTLTIQAAATGANDLNVTTGGQLDVTGALSTTGAGTITLGGTSIVTTASVGSDADITLNAAGGITLGGDVTSNGGAIDINADTTTGTAGVFSIGAGSHTISTTGTGTIDISADGVSIDTNATIQTGNGDITLNPTAGVAINLGSASGAFDLANTELATLSTTGTGVVVIGSTSAGKITVDDAAIGEDLTLITGADVDAADAGLNLSLTMTNTLIIDADDGVGDTSTFALGVAADTLSVNNTDAGDIDLAVTGDVTVTQLTNTVSGGDISLAASGTITVSDTMTLTNVITTTGSGTLTLDANGADSDVLINADISAGSGAMLITADDSVELGTGVSITKTGTGSLTIRAGEAGGADTGGDEIVMASDASIDAGTGAIVLDATADTTTGSISVASIETDNTGSTAVTITTDGAVTDANAGSDNVTTAGNGRLTVSSATGVSLDTVVGEVHLTNTGTGAIDVVDTDAVTVVNATQGTADQSITISAGGLLTVAGAVTTSGAGAGGTISLTGVGITVETGNTVQSGSGDITLNAGTGILTLDDTMSDRSLVTTAGGISITADDVVIGVSDTTTQLVAGASGITIENSSGDGIFLDATMTTTGVLDLSNDEVADISTSGVLTIGNASSGKITAHGFDAGLLSLHLVTGADVDDGTGTNITTAAGLEIDAVTGIGDSSTNTLGVAVGSLDLSVTGAGDIYVDDAGTLTLSGASVASDQTISVTSGGAMTVDGDVTAPGAGGITLDGGGININTGNTVDGGSGTIVIDANTGVFQLFDTMTTRSVVTTTGSIQVTANDIGIGSSDTSTVDQLVAGSAGITIESSTGGTIGLGGGVGTLNLGDTELADISTSGTLTIGSTTANTITLDTVDLTGQDVHLITGADVVDQAGLGTDLTADDLVIDAQTGVGTSANPLGIAVSTVDVDNSLSGDIELNNDGSVAIRNLTTVGGGDIQVDTTSTGTITISDTMTATVATVINSSGQLTLNAPGGADVIINDDINTAGNVNISGDAVTMASGTTLDAGNGEVTVSANTADLTIAAITTTSTDTNAVRLFALAGEVIDANGAATNVTVGAGGRLLASAGNGISLDTAVSVLQADNSTTGTIDISNTGDLSLSVGNADRDISIATTGALTVANSISGSGAGKISLSGVGVTVNAGQTISGGSSTGTMNRAVTIDAGTGEFVLADTAGTAGRITTTGGDIEITAGSIRIEENNLAINQLDAGAGEILLIPNGSETIGLGTGAGTFNLNNNELGDIATSSTLTIGSTSASTVTLGGVDITTDVGASGLHLITGGAIEDVGAGGPHITVATLTLDAGGAIGSTTALDIDVSNANVTASGGDVHLADVGTTSSTTYSITTGGSHSVTIDQSNNPLLVSGISTTGTITLTSSNGVVTTNGAISSGGSAVTIDGSDGVTIGGAVTTTGGQLDIDADTDTDGTGGVTINASGSLSSGGGDINIGAADGVSVSGNIDAAGGAILIDADTDTDTGSSNFTLTNSATVTTTGVGTIGIEAEDINLGANTSLSAGGDITLRNSQALAINLGAATGSFDLTDAELDRISTSGTLTIGSTSAGTITVDDVTIDDDLTLITGADVQAADAGLNLSTTGDLDIQADDGIGNTTTSLGVAALTLSASNATSGDIDLAVIGDVTIAELSNTGTGNVSLSASGSITIDDVSATGTNVVVVDDGNSLSLTATGTMSSVIINDRISVGSGTTTITADDAISMSADAQINTANGDVTLQADADDAVGGTNNIAMSDGSQIAVGSATITLDTNSGAGTDGGSIDVATLSTTNTTTMSVVIDSDGSVNDANGNDTNISSDGGLVITAAGNIGATTGTGTFDVQVTSISASSSGGGTIGFTDTGTLTIAQATTTAADVYFSTDGDVTVDGDVITNGAGTIRLEGANLQVNDDNDVRSQNADIDIELTGTLTLQDSGGTQSVIETTGTGNVNIIANDLVIGTGNTTTQLSSGGELVLQNQTLGRSFAVGGGTAGFDISDSEIGEISVTNDLIIGSTSAGTITFESADFSGVNLVVQSDMNVEDAGGGGPHITASSLNIDADTGVGTSSSLGVAVDSLNITNADSGVINVADTGTLTLTGAVQSSAGHSITIGTTGALAVTGNVTASGAGDIGLTGVGLTVSDTVTISGGTSSTSISLDSGAGILRLQDSGGAHSVVTTAGGIQVTADQIEIGTSDTTDQLVAGAGITISNSGAVDIGLGGAAGTLNLTDAELADISSGGMLTIGSTTATNITLDSVSLTGTDVHLISGGDVDDAGTGTHITAANLVIDAEIGVAALGTAVSSLDVDNNTSGAISIEQSGDLDIRNLTTLGGGDVSVTATGTITVSDTMTSTVSSIINSSGQLTLDANGAGNDVVINDSVTGVSGAVTITADDAVTMASGTTLNAGSAAITVTATAGDIALTAITTTNTNADAVTLSSGVAITDANGTTTNVTTGATGRLVATSVDGVSIDTAVGEVDISNTGIGTIDISDSGALSVINASQTLGAQDVSVQSVGALTIDGAVTASTSGLINLAGAGVTVSTGATVSGGTSTATSAVTIDAGTGEFALEDTATMASVVTTAGGSIEVTADTIRIDDNNTAIDQLTGASEIILMPDGTDTIGLGTGTGTFNLTNNELGDIAAGSTLVIGSTMADTITLGSVNVGAIALELVTGNAVEDTGAGGPHVTATTLTINAGGAVGSTTVLDTDITNLGAVTTAGNVAISDASGVVVQGVLNAGANNVEITAAGNITQTEEILAGGLKVTTTGGGMVTLTDTANVVSTFGASVDGTLDFYNAGDLDIGFGGTDGITSTNQVSLTVDGDLTQAAGAIIDLGTAGLEIVTTAGGSTGAITLTEANDIGEIAIIASGAVSFTNVDALNITMVGATNGITTSGEDVTVLVSGTGALTVTDPVDAGSADIVLTTTDGSIVDGNGTMTDLVTTGNVTLTAGGTGSIGSGDPIEIDPTASGVTLNSDNTISASSGVTFNELTLMADPTAGAVDIDIVSGNTTIDIDEGTTTDTVFINTVNNSDNADLNFEFQSSSNLEIANNAITTIGNGNVTISATGTLDVVTGAINTTSTGTIALSASGSVDLAAGGVSTSGDVNISSTSGGITQSGGVATESISTTGALYLEAASGVGTSGTEVYVTTGSLEATVSNGSVNLRHNGSLNIVNSASDANSAGIFVSSTGTMSHTITLVAESPQVVGAPIVNVSGGDITVVADYDGGGDDDLTVNANIIASGGSGIIELFAGHDVDINGANISNQGTGDINIYAGTDWDAGGTHTVSATGAGTVDVDSASTLTTAAGSGDILIISDVVTLDAAATISTSTGAGESVTFEERTDAVNIFLGAAGAGLSLTAAELATITTDVIQIGSTASGTVDFDAALTLTPGLAILSTSTTSVDFILSAASFSVAGTTALRADVTTTTGGQVYTGAVTLGADISLNSAGDVQIGTSLTGAGFDFDIATGNLDLDGNITGVDVLSVAGTSDLGAGVVTTTGAQTYSGAVSLGTDVVINAVGDVQFGTSIDGNTNSLTLQTGNLDLDGNATDLTTFNVTAGTANIGGDVTTTGTQTYGGAITLTGNRNLTGSTININAGLTGADNDLGITGDLILGGTAMTGLGVLTVSGNAILGANVSSSGDQTYGDDDTADTTTLSANVDLSSTGGTVIFDSAVDANGSTETLTVSNGDLEFRGAVGAGAGDELGTIDVTNGDLTITASGSIFESGAITADTATILGSIGTGTGTVTSVAIDGDVTLGADVTAATQNYGTNTAIHNVTLSAGVTLSGTTITFDSAIDGSNSLAVTGDAVFNGRVGGTTDVTSITVTGNTTLNDDIDTTGNQTYGDGDDTATLATNVILNTGGTVIFDGDVDGDGVAGGEALTVATGDLEFRGDVGVDTNNELGAIDVTNGDLTITAAGSIQGAGAITADGATIAGTIGTATMTANTVLSLAVDGDVSLGADVETTGAQTYGTDTMTHSVSLAAGVTLDGSTVTFNSSIDGGNTLAVDGNAVFNGRVGGSTDVTSITVTTGNTTLNNDIDTTGNQTYTATTLGGDVTLNGGTIQFASLAGGTNSLDIAS